MTGYGHCIRSVNADPGTKTLTLEWDDGSTTRKTMGPLIGTRRIFRPLSDAALFVRAHVVNDGRAIAWNDDIDLCADALWFEAHPEESPFVSHQPNAAE
ncbi:MAG: DUF2442 domain-containing protein [Alphaproteobacteria bacterium]